MTDYETITIVLAGCSILLKIAEFIRDYISVKIVVEIKKK
jgi:hypothetical protein